MMKKKGLGRFVSHIRLGDVIPFIAFIAIFVFFSIASNGIMFSAYNLKLLLSQSIVTILVGSGAMFVVAQGSIDLSVGVNLALSGVVATHIALVTNSAVLFIPVALVIATAIGFFNGIVVAKFKVDSFMTTIAMLIGLRGVTNYIQTIVSDERMPVSLRFLSDDNIRLIIFIVVMVLVAYVFEYTRFGKYSKAIGENEVSAKFVGIPVDMIKVMAFTITGFMSGIGSVFTVAGLGGTSQTMGVFFEMKVAMAIYFGGVLVTGGASAKMYKLLLGSFSITIIVNGLAIIGKADSQISESVEGFLLLIILFVTILSNRGSGRLGRKHKHEHEATDIDTEVQLDE
jgi:ribose transport system permease protein